MPPHRCHRATRPFPRGSRRARPKTDDRPARPRTAGGGTARCSRAVGSARRVGHVLVPARRARSGVGAGRTAPFTRRSAGTPLLTRHVATAGRIGQQLAATMGAVSKQSPRVSASASAMLTTPSSCRPSAGDPGCGSPRTRRLDACAVAVAASTRHSLGSRTGEGDDHADGEVRELQRREPVPRGQGRSTRWTGRRGNRSSPPKQSSTR
jgi:hypothetical protein